MFVKGPIVWAFVLPPLVLYQLLRNWRPDFPNAWSGWVPWIASFALFCLWVIFGIRFIDGFYEDVILNEFGARFHEGIHRSQPLLFYIPHLLQKFAPWSLLILGLLVVALRKTKAATGKVAGESLSGDVLADHMGAWRHRSDVIDSIEASGPNFPGHSSALSAAGCTN